ncbi:MAG: NAD(P)H-dependent oxidoreductase [Clostridia bacterium]|nr:NAD(P)H-dependent oxidoreductase [Clostridia bacterium]
MKVTVIYGQQHQGSTYRAAQLLLQKLHCTPEEISEFYVNGIAHCVGCYACIMKDEKLCPHRAQTQPIIEAIEAADVIVLASPNYCFDMTGQMKTFCDHMAYRWMIHRPADMRKKIGVAISTTAGAGAGAAVKNLRRQMGWWSVGRTYPLTFAIWAQDWEQIDPKRMTAFQRKADALARRINQSCGQVKPSIKTALLWRVMKSMHTGDTWNDVERAYWQTELKEK